MAVPAGVDVRCWFGVAVAVFSGVLVLTGSGVPITAAVGLGVIGVALAESTAHTSSKPISGGSFASFGEPAP